MSIPKIIFQTSKKKLEQYIVDKILLKCKDWKYLHFDDKEIIQFFSENYIEEFKDIVKKFNSMPTGAHKADLFRYYFLYINGGVFMDSDAMIEINIEDVVMDYDFFSVNSSYLKNFIFQGFIGAIPKHNIIYEALKNAYNINIKILSKNYHLLCKNLYNIIKNNDKYNTDIKVHLYEEKYNDKNSSKCCNEKNETILYHYWKLKIIPR